MLRNVLIIEDEGVIAKTIARKVISLGDAVIGPCATFYEAGELLSRHKVDLSLVDIRIKGRKDGIELAHLIREQFPMPIVFVTANGDSETLDRAKKTKPNAFILKPFTLQELEIAMEIAVVNFESSAAASVKSQLPKYLVLKTGYDQVKLPLNDIHWLASSRNYVTIKMRNSNEQKFRVTLREVEDQLQSPSFCRVSRSCIVNLDFALLIKSDKILIGDEYITMSKICREEIEASDAFKKFR